MKHCVQESIRSRTENIMKERICLLNKNQFLLYDNKVESRKKIEATRKKHKAIVSFFFDVFDGDEFGKVRQLC